MSLLSSGLKMDGLDGANPRVKYMLDKLGILLRTDLTFQRHHGEDF